MGKLTIQCPSAMAVFLVLSLVPAAHGGAGTPLVIAWQAPPGPSAPNFNTNLYNSPTCAPAFARVTASARRSQANLVKETAYIADKLALLGVTAAHSLRREITLDRVSTASAYRRSESATEASSAGIQGSPA